MSILSAQALPPLAIALPIAVACVLLAAGRYLARQAIDGIATGGAVLNLALAALLLAATSGGRVVTWMGGWQPRHGLSVGIVLVADRTNAGAALVIAFLTTAALLFGWRYFEDVHAHYHALVLLFMSGMTGFALTGDLFDMFVFFELMGAAAYALAGQRIEEPESVQGGLTFGVVNSLGAYLCLMGIGLLYGRTGQLGLAQIGSVLAGKPADPLVVAAFALIATGWLVKAAAVPFHFWLADAHAVAPTPICVLFSGVMAPLGVYGVGRVYWVIGHGVLDDSAVRRMLLVLGVLTAVLGAIMCFTQRHVKRLLAYSTIAHIGLFLIGLAALTPLGVAASTLYIAGHAGVKGSLFLLAGILLSRHHTVDEFELYGRGTRNRFAGALFLIGGLALAGLPPFGTGLGKSLLEETGFGDGMTALVIIVSAVTGGAVVRVGLRTYFGIGPRPADDGSEDATTGRQERPEVDEPLGRTPATMLGAVILLLGGGLLVGVVPWIARAAGAAATRFTDQHGFWTQVLTGATTRLGPLPETDWSVSGVLYGLLSAALATGLAFLAVHARRLPGSVRSGLRSLRPALKGLHRLHSGHLGDYAAWLVVGASAITGLLVFA